MLSWSRSSRSLRSAVASGVARRSTFLLDGPERVTVNDNRHPGGSLAGNVLTIRLEARMGQWFPDGDDQPGLTVKAFGVEGGPLQIPGRSSA